MAEVEVMPKKEEEIPKEEEETPKEGEIIVNEDSPKDSIHDEKADINCAQEEVEETAIGSIEAKEEADIDCAQEEVEETAIGSIEAKEEAADDSSESAMSPVKCPDSSTEEPTDVKQVSPEKSAEQSPKKIEKYESEAGEDNGDEIEKEKKEEEGIEEEKEEKKEKEDLEEEKENKEDKEEEEEEEEGEKKKGLFELPLVIEGTRNRKSTSFLKIEETVHPKHKAPVVAGSGTALEDIPFVVHQIDSEKKVIDLRPLYRICYGTQGKINSLRKELKKFNGFSFAKNSEEYKRKHVAANKYARADLARVRRILGLASGKTKEDEVHNIIDFLLLPHDEGKNVPKKAEKRKSGGKTPKKTAKKRAADDQSPAIPSKKTKKADSEDEGGEENDDLSSDSSEEKTELTPSDNEVKEKIAELVKTFDLSIVNMKQMVAAVFESFPSHPQLVDRISSIKAFIKEAVKDDE